MDDPFEIKKAERKRRDLHAQWKGYAEYRDSIENEDSSQKQIPIKPINKKIQNTVSEIFHKES